MFNIRSALATLLVVGGAVSVRAQQPARPAQPNAKHQMRGGPGMDAERALLRGITLSDAEKANLKSVRSKYEPQAKAIRDRFQPLHEQMRAARQRGDTAAFKSLMAQTSGEREQTRSLMTSERADIRSALTPANQAKFDANAATMKKRFAHAGKARPNRPGVGTDPR
jgi:Spy/CpxP family protein refolding chaperone